MSKFYVCPLYRELSESKYKDQLNKIVAHENSDIDATFLGFTDTYKYLAKLIPQSWEIYDFGPAYGLQAYYFRNHKAYFGIQPHLSKLEVLNLPNTKYHSMTGQEFLRADKTRLFSYGYFAIVNYVPDPEVYKMVKERFEFCFTYYPGDKENRRLAGEMGGTLNIPQISKLYMRAKKIK